MLFKLVTPNVPTNTEYNYEPAPGESLSDAQAREASVIAAWRKWQKSVDPRFYKAWGINLNDNTLEGMRHRRYPLFSVQYHPEASAGPHDSCYLFEEFRKLMG